MISLLQSNSTSNIRSMKMMILPFAIIGAWVILCSVTTVSGFVVPMIDTRTAIRSSDYHRAKKVIDSPICRNSKSSNDDDSSDSTSIDTMGITTTAEPTNSNSEADLIDAVFKGKTSLNSDQTQQQQQANDDDGDSVLDKLDGFLDKPFFDPDAYDDNDTSFLGKLARFVKNDYELFEAVFVACFFLLLITVAKDVLRAELHNSVTPSGRLF